MSEELVQQKMWLDAVVVLGSTVAAGSIVHTSPLGDVEPPLVAKKNYVPCEGCRASSRVSSDAELRSWPGAIADDAQDETSIKHQETKEMNQWVWKEMYTGILCPMAPLCTRAMTTMLQDKETNHCSIIIWFRNLILCLKLWKFQQQKQQWTRNWKNWSEFQRGTWRKSKVRNRWSMNQGPRALQFILHH